MEHERIVEVIPARYFPPVIRKVGIYCRVSTRYQEQLHSMAAQVSFFIQMAQSRYNWHLTDSYLDFRSGSTQSGREEFQRMMNDCRNKKIDLILTKNVSRFGRNTEEALITLRELRSLGVISSSRMTTSIPKRWTANSSSRSWRCTPSNRTSPAETTSYGE